MDVDAIIRRVRAAGLKLTPQRLAIVRELATDPTHPTAQELYERLRREQPTMSFATVYNTLDALAAAGLCSSLALAPGASRFDANMAPHDHLVCDGCGLVRDIHRAATGDHAGSPPAPVAAAPAGFLVRAVEQIYRGLCVTCVASADRAPPAPRAS